MASQEYSEKARKYLSLLDEARCNDRWTEVPELTRKVGKHAPQRQCLVYTARVESEIASRSSSKPPVAALNDSTLTGLRSAIENEAHNEEDILQARATLALALYKGEDAAGAKAALPSQLPPIPSGENKRRLQGWTYISAVKAAYVRECCAQTPDKTGSRHESALALARNAPSNIRNSSEYRSWLEKLLLRLCLVHSNTAKFTEKVTNSTEVERILAPFRAWSEHWDGRTDASPKPGAGESDEGGHRDVWRVYYFILSELLRCGYVYPSSVISKEPNPRNAQVAELRKVEATYEHYLLEEVAFPEASTINREVDAWADRVMENWALTCGSNWQDDDLGPGGREAASKHVLDILYRAATRTFHSCSILRHLFTVHASVAEFELAGKALDSYLEIVFKGKARVEKSGQAEPGLDSDEAMLHTIAYGIEMHCTFGKLEGARRAEKLSLKLEEWLKLHDKSVLDPLNAASQMNDKLELPVPPATIAILHRAIATSKATWAIFTLEPSERSTLQQLAIKRLRQSLIADPTSPDDPKTLYALALILAETRDIEGAIATVKHALSSHSQLASDIGQDNLDLKDHQKRTMARISVIQCWHLLALLLSSRQEFDKAEAACEAALESFEDQDMGSRGAWMKHLSFFEKQHIMEVKITQSLLLEVNGGAELAINAGGEALKLYAYLFHPDAKASEAHEPSRTADGPLKSLRGSLFGKKRATDATSTRVSTAPGSVYSSRISEDTTRPPTMAGTPDGAASLVPPGTSHSQVHRSPSQKLQKRSSRKSVSRGRISSPSRPATATTIPIPATAPQLNGFETGENSKTIGNGVGVAVSSDIPSSVAEQFDSLTATTLPPVTVEDTEWNVKKSARGSQNHSLPLAPLSPRFSTAKQEQYTLGLLSKIWAFISRLYRRAGLFDDARGAIEEAFKLANKAELHASTRAPSAKKYETQGWGGGKSVDEIWADIHAESARLSIAEGAPHEAMSKFETALSYFPEHAISTVGLSNLLLDIYSHALPMLPADATEPEKIVESEQPKVEASLPVLANIKSINPSRQPPRRMVSSIENFPSLTVSESAVVDEDMPGEDATDADQATKPKDLDRLAARDRAFGLLSTLTRQGTSWDDGEAWFVLARAYEESGQPDKAKEVLWWVVELEEKKPVRNWACLGQGYCC